MVISKSTSIIHPRPSIKETIIPNGGSATLPRVRTVSRRVAELPSLRYGTVGAVCPVSGPLRVRDPPPQPRKYARNFTTGVMGDSVPAIRTLQTRRVRFDLPPPDGSDTERSTTDTFRFVHDAGGGSTRSNTITNSYTNSSSPSSVGALNGWSATRSPNTNSNTGTGSRSTTFNRSSLPSSQHGYHHNYSQSQHYPQPVTSVTVVSTTTSVKQRAHPVGKYIRGTLSPTANSVVPATGAGPALLRAAREGDDATVRDVLRRAVLVGIPERELNAVDSSGRTALSYVASHGTVEILESILHLPGLDPNLPDNEGNTPLHFAAQAGQVECLNFLLSRCQGLEIDARNHLGFTPLMKAALQGRNKCAKLLLFAGANPTLRDTGKGLRAEQWARYCGRYVCADVIEKFARHRLLERSTSCGRWGSDSDIGTTRVLLGKVVPVPPQQVTSPPHQGIKSKLRKVFRTSSGPSHSSDTSSSARLVTQLTSAALCASSPVLPAAPQCPPVVKSLIRPLTVPRLQITLANGAANVGSDLSGFAALLDQENTPSVIEKPPRTKKKMK